MQTFLKPLSVEEEAHMLKMMSEGSPADSCMARQKLIEHNLRLVAHIVKKYQSTCDQIEDMLSIGTIGLIKAIDTYDAGRGIKLATYAARCIDNELLMMLRGRKKLMREVSIYEPIGTDKEGNEIRLLDVAMATGPDVPQEVISGQYLQKLPQIFYETLTPREQTVILMRYGLVDGRESTQSQIAAKLHISRSYVSRIEKKALSKLRIALENERG